MEKTNKGKEVIAYKGMNSDMVCRFFQYEIGKTYKTDWVELCKCGFHACLNPIDVFGYYSGNNSRYFKVKLSGAIAKCDQYDTNVAATEITILEEITDIFDEVIKTTEWWKNKNVLDLLYWSDGFTKVKRTDGLMNFFDKNGNYLSDEWFKQICHFNKGVAIVQRGDELYNLIDKNGNYLSDEWFINVYDFHNGVARVQRSDKLWNFINRQGKILSNEWFYWVDCFHEGFAEVQRINDEMGVISKNGKLLPNEWLK